MQETVAEMVSFRGSRKAEEDMDTQSAVKRYMKLAGQPVGAWGGGATFLRAGDIRL